MTTSQHPPQSNNNFTTITFAKHGDLNIDVDIWIPSNATNGASLGAVVYYHGGGLVSGNRNDVWFPVWLKDYCDTNNLIFLSPDYRLLHPSTGFEIIEDVKSFFTFISSPSFSQTHLPNNLKLDVHKVTVAGFSGGGYPARAAGLFADPKPKAILSVFGMGGDFLADWWVVPGEHPTVSFVFPEDEEKEAVLLREKPNPISDSPVSATGTGGFADEYGRMGLFARWVNNGTLLDVFTGHDVSEKLRALDHSERYNSLPDSIKPLFLEHHLTNTFPPTVLVHGKVDDVVLPEESQLTYDTLKKLGVETELLWLDGAGHGLVDQFGQPVEGADALLRQGADFLLKHI